jgi:hypothetical protein
MKRRSDLRRILIKDLLKNLGRIVKEVQPPSF